MRINSPLPPKNSSDLTDSSPVLICNWVEREVPRKQRVFPLQQNEPTRRKSMENWMS